MGKVLAGCPNNHVLACPSGLSASFFYSAFGGQACPPCVFASPTSDGLMPSPVCFRALSCSVSERVTSLPTSEFWLLVPCVLTPQRVLGPTLGCALVAPVTVILSPVPVALWPFSLCPQAETTVLGPSSLPLALVLRESRERRQIMQRCDGKVMTLHK